MVFQEVIQEKGNQMERSTKYISREKEMKMQRKTKRKGNEDTIEDYVYSHNRDSKLFLVL